MACQFAAPPPSGSRVPAEGEAGAVKGLVPTEKPPATATAPATGGMGAYLVAAGSFGVTANADSATARLAVLGYPGTRGRVRRGGTALVTVFARPFESSAAAFAAQDALRGQGFPDAVVIGP
ncbi:MAG: hypothetical protein C0524_18900 [Rhodobacter sp.]|nr:hypothetical protein [Rhodobacter sp.]